MSYEVIMQNVVHIAGLSGDPGSMSHLAHLPMLARMAMTPDGKSILFAIGNGGIQRLDVDTRANVPRITEITGKEGKRCTRQTPERAVCGDRKLSGEEIKDLDFVPYTPAAAASSQPSGASRAAPGSKALMVILDNGSAVAVDVDKGGSVLCRVQLATKNSHEDRRELKDDKVLLISSDDRLLLHHLPPGKWCERHWYCGSLLAAGMDRVLFTRVKCREAAAASGGEGRPALACLMNNRNGCHLAMWELGDDGLLSMRTACKAADAPGACMDVSTDGSLVAVGTSEGDVVLLGCRPHLRVVKRFPRAHMVFTTIVTFNKDATYVLSSSLDASVTVNSTALPPPPDFKKFLVLAFLLIAILLMCLLQVVKVLKQRGMSTEEILALLTRRPKEEL
ncbi:hypothetical protein VOLCADRAFT_96936 [Volvox carteri f. nagariensis]|uniref:Anaphase-promoting complex subunit 4 WD40 domain-containing protein n=1 Tax=Volvox carteri f. nagariensis TaxID=3068 RepID=D8UBD5_VOLCA|nr:uncharacterized protein VOLCADRAFT_96936 [Volvox carteri f. nagariensis]EFJ42984.1 hypothetical protein VOLCADRAFT_96936 [Volvox carteri f. nagariensis]|eukprot:XP_002956024.1 hypothetical protein VOLCADRAFT_96936 [Volvox carteri f. nagariensis]